MIGMMDFHCDTLMHLTDDPTQNLKSNELSVDALKLTAGGVTAQWFALFVDQRKHAPYARFSEMHACWKRQLELCSADFLPAVTAADCRQAVQEGKIAALLAVEEGGVLEGRLERLAELYTLGVRLMTLTWNYPNEIACPSQGEQTMQGLSPFGVEVVTEMERLGMIVDVSHLSDAGFADVAKIARKPFIASHSNARAICDHPRNLTDSMIKTLAEAGGVIGLNFCSRFLDGSDVSKQADMIAHLHHLERVGGSDVLALGTDFDGISCELEIANAAQLPNLITALEQSGFKPSTIDKMLWRNGMRVVEQCLG